MRAMPDDRPMEERRVRFTIELPELSQFEIETLRRLRAAAPEPISFSELCQPRTPLKLSYLSRLAALGLTSQFKSGSEQMFMDLTHVGEQVLAAVEAGQ